MAETRMVKTKKSGFWAQALDMTQEEFVIMHLIPEEASLLIEKNICRCSYYGQEIKLSKESIETLYILAEAKGRVINIKDLTAKLNYIDLDTLNKRIKTLNKQFKNIRKVILNEKSENTEEIVLILKKVGYKLNVDIVDDWRLWLAE